MLTREASVPTDRNVDILNALFDMYDDLVHEATHDRLAILRSRLRRLPEAGECSRDAAPEYVRRQHRSRLRVSSRKSGRILRGVDVPGRKTLPNVVPACAPPNDFPLDAVILAFGECDSYCAHSRRCQPMLVKTLAFPLDVRSPLGDSRPRGGLQDAEHLLGDQLVHGRHFQAKSKVPYVLQRNASRTSSRPSSSFQDGSPHSYDAHSGRKRPGRSATPSLRELHPELRETNGSHSDAAGSPSSVPN